ncbi:MAG: hypothetical protein K6G12_03185 [Lachnospiraceae bacterium]|nr:hypothetical protein [Lachnospiraceae bacterium]
MVHVFIINPKYTEKNFATKLRDRLSKIPELTYYVFTTGAAGDETELARTIEEIFEGEQYRIYCCGGIQCVRNIINGLRDISKVEIAVFPTMRIKYLDALGPQSAFENLEDLINGSIKRVDYIKTNHGVALNVVSFGIDPYIYRVHNNISELRIFGKRLPWGIAVVYALLVAPNYIYNLEVEGKSKVQKASHISVSNVLGPGKDYLDKSEYDVTDGMASYMLAYRFGFISRILFAVRITKNKIKYTGEGGHDEKAQITKAKIRHMNGVPIWGNMDGEQVLATEWKIEVVKQGLKLVIPAGTMDERA